MIALRQILVSCCLACLLLAGVAAPAAGADQAEPPPSAPLDLLELLAKWLGFSDEPEDEATPDPQYQMESWSQEPVASEPPQEGKAPDPRYWSRLWSIEPAASGQSQFWRMPPGVSAHLGPWGLRRSLPGLLSRSGSGGRSEESRPDPVPDFRPSQFHLGKVSSDFGRHADELGVEDSVRMARAGRVRIDIKDLLRNDLGWKCEGACDLNKANKLDLRDFAGEHNIKLILQKGKFIYVQADERRQKSIFTYEVFDRATRATADVRVNVWFGNRLPRARSDKLVGFANAENVFDVSDLLGNDRDRDGDLLDLVRVWCPEDGRVFMREVDGELKIFFQPDEGFTGVAYFKYTIADLSDPDDVGDPSRERKTFAEGIVRVRVLASPS
jgi:Bacterial Ig domain